MATGMGAKRLGKELQKMQRGMPHGITIVKADDFREWLLDIQVFDNPIYEGQTFRLSLLFGGNYPIECPEVCFIEIAPSRPSTISTSASWFSSSSTSTSSFTNGTTSANPIDLSSDSPPSPSRPIPLHPHIYSNGIICLDMLGTGWSPVHSAESICISIQSMLAGNIEANRPKGDEEFCRSFGRRGRDGWGSKYGGGIKSIRFAYDDDKV